MTEELVILVDDQDNEIGTAEKIFAHENNLLHRAFSIFIFRDGKVLLQQRALTKYHSPGLWTNTCCSHPRPGEDILAAGRRRLREELGFEVELKNVGSFQYNAHFDNGLAEHELDHVLVGEVGEIEIKLTPEEVNAVRWVGLLELEEELKKEPDKFTPWLKGAIEVINGAAPVMARGTEK